MNQKFIKFNRLNFLLIISSFLLIACSRDNDAEPKQEIEDPTVTISLTDLYFSDSQTDSQSFTITSDNPWNIEVSDSRAEISWIKVSPTSGVAGKTKVDVTILEKNESYDDRNAFIKIKIGNITKLVTVTQKKKDALILSKDKVEMNKEGGEFEIELQTNNSYEVEITDDTKGWIKRKEENRSRGIERRKETFIVDMATPDGKRKGEIIFKSGSLRDTVYVYQVQQDILVLSQRNQYINNEGGYFEIDIKSNIEYNVIMPQNIDWIESVNSRAIRVDKVAFNVKNNESYDSRNTYILIKDKNSELSDTIFITQSQVNAIILGQKKYDNVSCSGDKLNISVKTNINYEVIIPKDVTWITNNSKSRGLREDIIELNINSNDDYDRQTPIYLVGDADKKDTIYIKQDGVKTILMDLYNEMDGKSWKDNTNWGSDKPLKDWYGVRIMSNNLIDILLFNNNVSGKIPKSLGKLSKLNFFSIGYNEGLTQQIKEIIDILSTCPNLSGINICSSNIYGELTSNISLLKNLDTIVLNNNKINGTIPKEYLMLDKLKALYLNNNQLTGTIPSNFDFKSTKLKDLNFSFNNLTGSIPDWFSDLSSDCNIVLSGNKLQGEIDLSFIKSRSNWDYQKEAIIFQQNGVLSMPDSYAPLKNYTLKGIDNNTYSIHDYFYAHKYSIIYITSLNSQLTPTIKKLLNNYDNEDLGAVIGYMVDPDNPDSRVQINNYINNYSLQNALNVWGTNGKSDESYYSMTCFAWGNGAPSTIVVDNRGKVIRGYFENQDELPQFISSLLGDPADYESTDYSKDGEIITLQKATIGKGINLLILGDGFTDKTMDKGGVYETRAKLTMEKYFNIEPTKSLRNLFNVYCIKLVSKNSGIGSGRNTALSVNYGSGTRINGDNTKCYNIALNNYQIFTTLNNLNILVMINDDKYAGTCYMYSNNMSISYCPYVYNSEEYFSEIIHHEAVGHGLGKLGDEYWYYGTIPLNEKLEYINDQIELGWWLNVDFPENKPYVGWYKYINNPLYSGSVGIYEGGLTYQYGVLRSTENSIMLDNSGEFNVPSREALYRRMIELSGNIYSHEEFLKYDKINITSPSRSTFRKKVKSNFVPLAPPVIIKSYK